MTVLLESLLISDGIVPHIPRRLPGPFPTNAF